MLLQRKNPQNARQPNKYFVGSNHTSTRQSLLSCCMLSMIFSWNSKKCFVITNGKMNKTSNDRTYYLTPRKVPIMIIEEETS